jgi:predicted nucleic acid-binding protein
MAFLLGELPALRSHFERNIPSDILIPAPVAAELMGASWLKHPSTADKHNIETFIETFDIAPFDAASAKVYAQIVGSLKPNAVIPNRIALEAAAMAISSSATLVTGLTATFKPIKGLSTETWAELDC